jgi:Bacterial PH domain
MTYRPTETSFGPPLLIRVPSLLYGLLAVAAVVVVLVAEGSPPTSWLFVNVVQRGLRGFMSARVFAGCLVVGAVASLLRANMRGVRVRPDGVEYRDVVALGIPKLRRFKWAQIDRVILDAGRHVALDLWDGTRALLPEVSDRSSLAAALEKVAHARAIPVRGGHGLDELPDASELADDDESEAAS